MHLVTLAAVTTTSQPAVAGRTEQQEQQHGQRPCRHGPSIYQPTSGVVSSDRLRRKWVNVNEWWPVKEGACFAIHGNTIRITLPICAGDARMQFGWGRVIQLTWPTRLCRQGTIRACVPVAVASNSIYSGITISTVKKAARRHRARRAKVRAAAGRPADQGRIGGAWKGQARRAAWEGREGSSLCRRANKRGERALQEEAAGRPPGPRPPRSACMVPHAVMHAPNAGPAGRMGNSTSSRPQGRETFRGVKAKPDQASKLFVVPVSQSSSGLLLLLPLTLPPRGAAPQAGRWHWLAREERRGDPKLHAVNFPGRLVRRWLVKTEFVNFEWEWWWWWLRSSTRGAGRSIWLSEGVNWGTHNDKRKCDAEQHARTGS